MAHEDKAKDKAPGFPRLLTPEGKPLRVLSTSLGMALIANALLMTGASAADSSGTATTGDSTADEPKLVAWSTDEVKQYFDKNTDWSIPLPEEKEPQETDGDGSQEGSSGDTTIINNYGGGYHSFGWDNLLLYHMLFHTGFGYAPSTYYKDRRTYYTGTSQTYKPRTYSSGTFQNKSVVGSTVRPKTSTSSGSITRRGTSSKAGGIGGKSSGFSSSGSKSSSSGGFGG